MTPKQEKCAHKWQWYDQPDGDGAYQSCHKCALLFSDYVPPTPPPATKDTNPKDAAATARLDLSLVPESAIAYCALAMTEGHLKYGGYNWRDAGVLASVYYAAMGRHRGRWWNGQDNDAKTGIPELAYIMANCAILIDTIESGKLVDDRPPRQDADSLLARFETVVGKLQAMFTGGPKRHTEKKP